MNAARSICLAIVLTAAAGMAIFDIAYESARGTLEGSAATGQLNGGDASYLVARAAARGDLATMLNAAGLAIIVGGALFLTATRPRRTWSRLDDWDTSARLGGLIVALGVTTMVAACGPYKKEVIEEIQPNETAFLVPLEGETRQQDKFQSVEYLESRKVAVKRVTLPQRKHTLGRMWTDYKWIPTARLIRVDRSPMTREWTRETSTGTSNTNQAIYVESSDSIGFGIGVNITAAVEEPNTAKFLYHYAGKPLEFVIDTNIRGRVASFLSREFGRWPLEQCRSKKVEIFDQCQEAIRREFEGLGITIRNLGYAEGMVYADAEIQKAINETFVVELRKNIAEEERKAQEIVNRKEVGMAVAKRQQAEEFAKAGEAQKSLVELEVRKTQAQALLTAATRWNGAVPTFLFASGFTQDRGAPNFLMNLPGPAAAQAMTAPAGR